MRLKPCPCCSWWTGERDPSAILSEALKYQSDASALWFASADSSPELCMSPLTVDRSLFGPVKAHQQWEYTCFDPSNTGLWRLALWLTLPRYRLAGSRRDLSLFRLDKTWTDYLSLDLWIVQWHTGAAMELHNEALWRQRQASLAAPHPGYLICERSLTGATARSRDSPQDQRRECQTSNWSLAGDEITGLFPRARSGDAGGDGGPPVTQLTLRMWVCNY